MISAGTTSVRRAETTVMAIPLWTAVEGRPPYPPTSRWSARAGNTPCVPGFGTCIAGVVSYARSGWIEPARLADADAGESEGARHDVLARRLEGCTGGLLVLF